MAGILLPILLTGLINVVGYVLIALGFTLLFGVSRVLNVTYAALYMVTGYVIYYFVAYTSVDLVSATLLAILIATGVGLGIFVLCLKFTPDPMRFLIASLLFAVFLEYLFSTLYGETGYIVPGLVTTREFLFFGVSISEVSVLAAGVALVLLAVLWIWIDFTNYGKTIRAAAEDPETASLFGIRVGMVYLVVVAVSSVIIALDASLTVASSEVVPEMWITPFVVAFIVAVIGGLGRFKWTVPAAFLLSFSQSAVNYVFPAYQAELPEIVAFAVAIVFILALPQGLGGILHETA